MTPLRVGSLCSGVGGIDLGFERAGCRTIGFVEWDKHCQSVLRRHWPTVNIASDLKETHVRRGSADVIIGGTPCQDLSVAGERAGLDGSRSSLFFDYARVIGECEPEWIVWENVAGALTSGKGRDMGTVIGELADLGYGVAWRVLDAQYFGVAQRRRRVVLVGRRGDVRSAGEVLALGDSVQGNPPPRDPSTTVVATVAGSSTPSRGVVTALTRSLAYGADDNNAQAGHLLMTQTEDVAKTILTQWRLNAADENFFTTSRDVASTLTASAGHHGHSSPRGDGSDNLVATFRKKHRTANDQDFETWVDEDFANTLNVAGNTGDVRATTLIVPEPTGVRRLTPRECERLQGFPDDWTRYDADGKEIADGPRYRMMGNSVAVPVFEWVAKRLVAVHNQT